MSKDRRFTIRIRDADIEFLEKNLPPEVSTLSEAFRKGALQLAEGVESGSIDISRISELIIESEQRIISEIQQNRALQVSLQSILQNQGIIQKSRMKKAAIEQIIESWLSDLEKLQGYHSIDDLESSVEFDHLGEFVLDALKQLQDRNYVTVEPSGNLRWNL